MGGSSKSSTSSAQTTQNQQHITTTTQGVEDVRDSNVALGNQQITQISTDQGAVEAGRRIGEAALDLAGEATNQAIKAATSANDRSLDFGEAALDTNFRTSREAIEAVQETAAGVTDFAGEALDRSLDFGSETVHDAFSLVADTGKQANALNQQAISTVSKAVDQAASASRSDSTESFQKIILYVSIAGAVAVVGAAVFRRRS